MQIPNSTIDSKHLVSNKVLSSEFKRGWKGLKALKIWHFLTDESIDKDDKGGNSLIVKDHTYEGYLLNIEFAIEA